MKKVTDTAKNRTLLACGNKITFVEYKVFKNGHRLSLMPEWATILVRKLRMKSVRRKFNYFAEVVEDFS